MNHVASHIGKHRLPPDLMAQLSGQVEPQAPRSTMSIRRRLELAFPARIAYRITDVIRPTTDDDRALLASAKTVFNAVWLEPVADYTEAERRKFVARLNREQRELLDRYLEDQGIRVRRYSGAEITANPVGKAVDALNFVLNDAYGLGRR